MSTLEKNINTIQNKLAKLKPGSRNHALYIERLAKKINQYMRFKKTRTREESVRFMENIDLDLGIRAQNKKAFNL